MTKKDKKRKDEPLGTVEGGSVVAANYIEVNKPNEAVNHAIRGAKLLRDAEMHLKAGVDGMAAMKDGDGSQAGHFALLASECEVQQNGYASANAAAKALFDETNSVSGNAATAIAAAKQLCAFLGV